jgi:putative MATE family efflux protein
MHTKKTLITDFTSGPVARQLVVFATPLFLSSLLQVLYNMADMIIVGNKLGEVGLSAVSVGGDVTAFLTFFAIGFTSAGQVIISKYIGKGENDKIGRFVATMFTILLSVAVLITAVCLFLRDPILNLMNTPEDAYLQARDYSTVCMIGLVFIYGYNIVSSVLRGLGDSLHPFIFIGIAAVLNVVLDIIFVLVLDMKSGGAALATVISQATSFLISIAFIFKKRASLGFAIKARDFITIDRAMLGDLLALGLPMAIKFAAIQFSKLFVNAWVNSYGVAVSAFAGIANKIGSISNLISNSLNAAGSSMVSQNISAGKFKRAPRISLVIAAITFGIATVFSISIVLFTRPFFSIFTSDVDSIIDIAIEYLPIAVLLFFGSAARSPANAIINGSGNYTVNFATAILDGIVLRIGLSLLFGIALRMGYLGFWLGDALAGFTPFVIGIVFYLSGKWRKNGKSST